MLTVGFSVTEASPTCAKCLRIITKFSRKIRKSTAGSHEGKKTQNGIAINVSKQYFNQTFFLAVDTTFVYTSLQWARRDSRQIFQTLISH
jgi:hypothetical protein